MTNPARPAEPGKLRHPIRPALPWSLARLMAERRVGRDRSAAILLTLSVTLTVALCLFVISMLTLSGWQTVARVAIPALPCDAIMLFSGAEEASQAAAWLSESRSSLTFSQFPFIEADTKIGPLLIMGIGVDVPQGVIVLSPKDAFLASEMGIGIDTGESAGFTVWPVAGGPSLSAKKLEWSEVWLAQGSAGASPTGVGASVESGHAAVGMVREQVASLSVPSGWAVVSRESLEGAVGLRNGLAFEFTGDLGKAPKPKEFASLERRYPEAAVYGPWSGKSMVTRQLLRSALLWQVVYGIGALTGVAAIACVLTASFMGRKRALGILKVLGGTKRDLRRVVLAEALYLGALGIPLGSAVGFVLSRALLSSWVVTPATVFAPLGLGIGALMAGALLPVRLVRNATCDQLLNNRPIYAMSNPSCAQCGLCGGF